MSHEDILFSKVNWFLKRESKVNQEKGKVSNEGNISPMTEGVLFSETEK